MIAFAVGVPDAAPGRAFSLPFYSMAVRQILLAGGLFALIACQGPKPVTVEDYSTRMVSLPGGQKIRAEVMMREADVQRGMKYRDSLAEDRGMLFLHGSPGNYAYWMHEVRIPLDMIWMDENKRIVEMYRNAKPCPDAPEKCPVYGGRQQAVFVLELAGGMADRYGLKLGQQLEF